MREIKFRAFHKKNKVMRILDFLNMSKAQFCGVFVEKLPDDLFGIATVAGDLWNFPDVEVMQYTGLKDKNGVEIYEGDIVNLSTKHNFKITYNLSSFVLVHPERKELCLLEIAVKNGDAEVIGNIYENKELLKCLKF